MYVYILHMLINHTLFFILDKYNSMNIQIFKKPNKFVLEKKGRYSFILPSF